MEKLMLLFIRICITAASILLIAVFPSCGKESKSLSGGEKFVIDDNARAAHLEASNLFEQYLKGRPEAEAKNKAIKAFSKWCRVPGSVKYVEDAVRQIPFNDDLWGKITDYVYIAYCNEYRKKDALILFEKLQSKVESSQARSVMLFRTGRNRMLNGDANGARSCFNEVIKLNADNFYIENSKLHLHDMDNLSIGKMAPDFKVTDIKGNAATLKAFKGKHIILFFWNSYCPMCSGYITAIKNIQSKKKNTPIAVIAVGIHDTVINLSKYAKENNMPWIIVSEENSIIKDINTKLMYAFNAHEIPYICILDPNGIIRDKINPEEESVKTVEIESRIEKALE